MKNIIALLFIYSFSLLSLLGVANESFESSTGGWASTAPASSLIATVADGAPAAAITEGKSCLKLISDTGGTWCQLAVNQELLPSIKGSDALSFDLYVPEGVLPTNGWAKLQVRLFGGQGDIAAFDMTHDVELALNEAEGRTCHVEWQYVANEKFDTNCNWAHIGLVKIASGGTMSPLYIDNVKFKQSEAGATMNSTDGFLLGAEWGLLWNDEFNGAKDSAPAEHWRAGAIWKKDGTWRDATLSRDEAYLDGKGNLVMRTRYEGGKRLAPYLATSEKGTYPKDKSITFGPGENGIFIEWRANVSQFKAYAAWFALWLYSDTPYTGDPAKGSEIDVMEYVPFQNDAYSLMNIFNAAVHIANGGPTSASPPRPYGHTKFDAEQWHTWGLHWTKDRQVFYLDGKPYWVNTKNVSTDDTHGLRMTIEIANGDPEKGNKNSWGHAVGKFEDNPESRLPSYAYIDYVRVYKKHPAQRAK